MKLYGFLFALLVFFTGCSSTVNTSVADKIDLRRYRHIYVLTALNDSNHIDELLATELRRLGYDANAGVRTMMPDNAEVTIEYEHQMEWDFRQYLIQINLSVRDARTQAQLAEARIFHPGVTRKTPEKMVEEVLAPLFGPETKKR
jgi:hypothetical protein